MHENNILEDKYELLDLEFINLHLDKFIIIRISNIKYVESKIDLINCFLFNTKNEAINHIVSNYFDPDLFKIITVKDAIDLILIKDII